MKSTSFKFGILAISAIVISSSLASAASTVERTARDCETGFSYSTDDLAGEFSQKVEGLDVRWHQGNDLFVYVFEKDYNTVSGGEDVADNTGLALEHRVYSKINADNKPLLWTSKSQQYSFTNGGKISLKAVSGKVRTEYKDDGVTLDYRTSPGITYHQPNRSVRKELDEDRYTILTTNDDLDFDATGAAPTVHVTNQKLDCTYRKYSEDDFAKIASAAAVKATARFDVLVKKVDAAQNDVDVCTNMDWDCIDAKKALKAATDARDAGWKNLISAKDYVGLVPFIN